MPPVFAGCQNPGSLPQPLLGAPSHWEPTWYRHLLSTSFMPGAAQKHGTQRYTGQGTCLQGAYILKEETEKEIDNFQIMWYMQWQKHSLNTLPHGILTIFLSLLTSLEGEILWHRPTVTGPAVIFGSPVPRMVPTWSELWNVSCIAI